jgi:SAM-dependent methyltransferase
MTWEEKNYQGYSSGTLGSALLEENVFYESERAFRLHFNSAADFGKCIDFGGRIGERTRKIRDIVVFEIDKGSIEWMKNEKILCIGNIEGIQDNSLDMVYCSHVLEHIKNYNMTLDTIRRKLKDGGQLILVVPVEFPKIDFGGFVIDENGHIQNWGLPNIFTVLDNSGFAVEGWKTLFVPLIPFSKRLFCHSRSVPRAVKTAYLDIQSKLLKHKTIRFVAYAICAAMSFSINSFIVFPFSVFGKRPPSFFINPILGEIVVYCRKPGQ